MQTAATTSPNVWLVGDVEHPDFADAVALVREGANLGVQLPELIVVAQSRPGSFPVHGIERLRRSAPLAGIVALAGSWCEGESRSGRPAAGVARLYWHEFPSWWRRQLAFRAAGRCPEWARPAASDERVVVSRELLPASGTIAIDAGCWDSAAAIADVVHSAGERTIWLQSGREVAPAGITAGIWEGGQLNDREAERLAAFCATLAPQQAPVLALLDFPRRDRCEAARHAGAAAVMGKPWSNVDLVAMLRHLELAKTRASHAA
jgi:hypothetical protein